MIRSLGTEACSALRRSPLRNPGSIKVLPRTSLMSARKIYESVSRAGTIFRYI
jgi:hypothetical protein